MFKIFLAPRAAREFAKLSKETQQKLYNELTFLSVDPYRYRKVKKIRGSKFGYRLRLGRWRILFAIFRKDKRVEVVDIFLRKERHDYHGKRLLR